VATIIQQKPGGGRASTFKPLGEQICYADPTTLVFESKGQPSFTIVQSEDYWFAYLGRLWFHNATIALSHLARLFTAEDPGSTLEALNGHFFLFGKDRKSGSVLLVNDRFSSQLIFAAETDSAWCFSSSYAGVRRLCGIESGSVNQARVFEFVKFRRLFGLDTYHDGVKLLHPAMEIRIAPDQDDLRSTIFWRPSYENTKYSPVEWEERISSSITESVEKYFTGNDSRGLMLSGGLDARALLSVGRNRYETFTNVEKLNNEFAIARELANSVGTSHQVIFRPKDYFDNWFDSAIACSSGMTVFHEAQFIGYEKELADVHGGIDLGLALDIFFCGHYLPKGHPSIFGRNAWYFKLNKLPTDALATYFMDNVSYRLKTSDPNSVFRQHACVSYRVELEKKISLMMEDGRRCGASGYDLWEYMHLFNFGRHYSMLMANSIRCYREVGVPALDNTIYQNALNLPVHLKYNWDTYLGALKKLNRGLMKIPNSNTNIRADRSLYRQTGVKIARGLLNAIAPGSAKHTPAYWDRSWPLTKSTLEQGSLIKEKLCEMENVAQLYELDSIDIDSVRKLIKQYRTGAVDHSILINMLLTIEYGVLRQDTPGN
jgi:hypothetical protein